mgnify:CR=1 FL=1
MLSPRCSAIRYQPLPSAPAHDVGHRPERLPTAVHDRELERAEHREAVVRQEFGDIVGAMPVHGVRRAGGGVGRADVVAAFLPGLAIGDPVEAGFFEFEGRTLLRFSPPGGDA